MKALKKIIAVSSLLAGMTTLGFSGAANAALAAAGYHILNETSTDYTTDSPASCPGVVFPAVVKANSLNFSNENQIKIVTGFTGPCSTTYINNAKIVCAVTLDPTGGNPTLTAKPLDSSVAPNACKMSNAMTAVLSGVATKK